MQKKNIKHSYNTEKNPGPHHTTEEVVLRLMP